MYDLTKAELRLLRHLDSPRKVQDYIDAIPANHEPEGDTCLSPRRVMRENRAHCIEGAMLAALAFRVHGYPALVLDLTSSARDFDHVIAPFRQHGCWGAVSKTNHASLRYREPVYKTIRELVLSYFHEYFNDDGYKTLRSYSLPLNLARFDRRHWMTNEEDNWFVAEYLCDVRHIKLLSRAQIATLRRAHPIERKAGMVLQWKKSERQKH